MKTCALFLRGIMNLSQAKLGDKFYIFVDVGLNMSDKPTKYVLPATIIATKKPSIGTDLILGWLPNQQHPANATNRASPSAENDYVANQAMYPFGKAVKRSLVVATQIIGELDGFACKACGVFFQYALPNQNDGTLICWSCRSS